MYRSNATTLVLKHIQDEPIVSNLGPTSNDLWHAGQRARNFYTYGAMGLCSSIALGMALSIPEKVVSLDGDGSLLMNMGTIATIGREKSGNLIVIVWDNEEWGQTGHQPSHTAMGTNLEQVARGCGITRTATVSTEEELETVFKTALKSEGPWFIVAKIQESDNLPFAPIEPEMTLHRCRETFVGPPLPAGPRGKADS